jgi:hypothetical protein
MKLVLSEGFWRQGNVGLGLCVENLSDEKRSYLIASKLHHTSVQQKWATESF